jgi:hypothetical protein
VQNFDLAWDGGVRRWVMCYDAAAFGDHSTRNKMRSQDRFRPQRRALGFQVSPYQNKSRLFVHLGVLSMS